MVNGLRISRKYILLLGMCLSVFISGVLSAVGYAGFLILFFCILFLSMNIKIDRVFCASLLCIILLFSRVFIQMIEGTLYDGSIHSLIAQVFVFIYVIMIRSCKVTLLEWKWIFTRFSFYIFIIAIVLLRGNLLQSSPIFFSTFGNFLLIAFGMVLILTQMYDGNEKRFFQLLLFVFIVCTFLSGMRSAVISEVAGIFLLFCYKFVGENRRFNNLIFVLVTVSCFLVPFIYLEFYSPSTDFTRDASFWIQTQVHYYSGSRFFSGRNVLWDYIFPVVSEYFFFGCGVGFSPGMIFDTNLSTHNLFLFIRLELGMLGLLAFIGLLFTVWRSCFLQPMSEVKYAVQSVMFIIMLQQTFSLGLLGGKGVYSILCWTVLLALQNNERKMIDGD